MSKSIKERCKVMVIMFLLILFLVFVAVPIAGVHHGRKFLFKRRRFVKCSESPVVSG